MSLLTGAEWNFDWKADIPLHRELGKKTLHPYGAKKVAWLNHTAIRFFPFSGTPSSTIPASNEKSNSGRCKGGIFINAKGFANTMGVLCTFHIPIPGGTSFDKDASRAIRRFAIIQRFFRTLESTGSSKIEGRNR